MNFKSIFQFFIATGIFLLIISNLFKVMHWPFANVMMIIAYAIIVSVYPRIILMKEKKTKLDLIKVLAIFIWGGCGMAYLIYYPEYRYLLSSCSRIGLIIWASIAAYTYLFPKDEKLEIQDRIVQLGYVVGVTSLTIGIVFKIMHWPFAGILIVVGLSIAGIVFFYSEFIQKKE